VRRWDPRVAGVLPVSHDLVMGLANGAFVVSVARPFIHGAVMTLLAKIPFRPVWRPTVTRGIVVQDVIMMAVFNLLIYRNDLWSKGFWLVIVGWDLYWYWRGSDNDDRRRKIREVLNRVQWRSFAPSPIPVLGS
jgi:hypothetical protein